MKISIVQVSLVFPYVSVLFVVFAMYVYYVVICDESRLLF